MRCGDGARAARHAGASVGVRPGTWPAAGAVWCARERSRCAACVDPPFSAAKRSRLPAGCAFSCKVWQPGHEKPWCSNCEHPAKGSVGKCRGASGSLGEHKGASGSIGEPRDASGILGGPRATSGGFGRLREEPGGAGECRFYTGGPPNKVVIDNESAINPEGCCERQLHMQIGHNNIGPGFVAIKHVFECPRADALFFAGKKTYYHLYVCDMCCITI